MRKTDKEFVKSINEEILYLWGETKKLFEDYTKKEIDRINSTYEEEEKRIDEIDKRIIEEFRTPALIHKLPTKCRILFIGLNPSYSESGIENLVNDKKPNYLTVNEKYSKEKVDEFFIYNSNMTNSEHIKDYEKLAHDYYAYFKKFDQLAYEYLDVEATNRNVAQQSFMHIDLFYLRETKAKKIEKYLNSKELKFFFKRQLFITDKIIRRLKPEVILVANACASKIFKELYLLPIRKVQTKIRPDEVIASEVISNQDFLKIDGKKINKLDQNLSITLTAPERVSLWLYKIASGENFEKELGTYRIKFEDKKTVVFFSGMLSGQRALDLDTYRRLRWHLLKIRDIINKPQNTPTKTPWPWYLIRSILGGRR